MLALMGDTIDNIKGVPGIGEKGARDLISTHGSLDRLLENAGSLTQKKYREALLAQRRLRAREQGSVANSNGCAAARGRHVLFRLPGTESPEVLRALLDARIPHARDRIRTDGRHRQCRLQNRGDRSGSCRADVGTGECRTIRVERHRRLPRWHACVARRHLVFDGGRASAVPANRAYRARGALGHHREGRARGVEERSREPGRSGRSRTI